ncbi:hypothetical protein CKA32_001347 [Geitlerinema sp. FC II]|nr:hypothetical protein CKA32_001347 [Geitlerinema sp. FC II]
MPDLTDFSDVTDLRRVAIANLTHSISTNCPGFRSKLQYIFCLDRIFDSFCK